MATETPFEGDVHDRRKQAVIDKILLRDLTLRHKLGVVGMVGLALLPTLMTPRELSLFTGVLYVMMFAISWDVVSGYTGQLSFGHAFFFALGGYGTAVITNQHLFPLFGQSPGTGWTLAIVMAGIVGGTLLAAIGGVLIGVPALRLEGPYLSLVTLIAPLLLYQTFQIFSDGMPYLAPEELGVSAFSNRPALFVSTGTKNVVRVGARWVARVNGVRGHLALAFQAMTGVGVVSGALKYYGLGNLAPFFIALTGAGMLAFAYLYTEGGVWNQVSRDSVDLSSNFTSPSDLLAHRIGAQHFAYLAWLQQANGEAPDDFERIREDLVKLTEDEWARLRDGVDVEDIYRQRTEDG